MPKQFIWYSIFLKTTLKQTNKHVSGAVRHLTVNSSSTVSWRGRAHCRSTYHIFGSNSLTRPVLTSKRWNLWYTMKYWKDIFEKKNAHIVIVCMLCVILVQRGWADMFDNCEDLRLQVETAAVVLSLRSEIFPRKKKVWKLQLYHNTYAWRHEVCPIASRCARVISIYYPHNIMYSYWTAFNVW